MMMIFLSCVGCNGKTLNGADKNSSMQALDITAQSGALGQKIRWGALGHFFRAKVQKPCNCVALLGSFALLQIIHGSSSHFSGLCARVCPY